MELNPGHLRRPLGLLSVSLLSTFVLVGTFELLIFDELGTATFVLSAVTYATLMAHIFEIRYGTDPLIE
ncbi:hypothetical protein [Halohasta salina]|uniref:hypothetical protein n=1 Tax=Halohasta salina TaxID=2961621 RepID=UPI0020A59E50|nr:hypothetical protein [Halohasta salina]